MKLNYSVLLGIIIILITAFTDKSSHEQNKHLALLKWKMGIALYSFNHHSFNKALSMAESTEAKYVEGFSFQNMGAEFNNKTMGELDEAGIQLVRQMLRKRNLTLSSMYVANANNEEQWKKSFENGRKLGLKYIVCEPDKNQLGIIDSLADIYNIKVAIHQHVKGSSIYWHPDSVLSAIKNYKNIGACADLGHWVRSGLDPVRCLEILSGHIIGIHLKDIDKAGKDVALGEGVINFPNVVKELKKQKFSGTIQVECEHNMKDNLEDVKKAIRYFNAAYIKN